MVNFRIIRRVNAVSTIITSQKIVLCCTLFSALNKLLHKSVQLPNNDQNHSCESIMEAIGNIRNLAMREKFYKEILFEDRGKHRAIYETWYNEDKNGGRYITPKGKCDKYVAYNHTLSEEIPVNREIWDMRPKECSSEYKDLNYDELPSVSVIIPFHNENFATVMRTVHSLMYRSPRETLREILLVDDGSTDDLNCLKEELAKAVFTLPRVKLVRTVQREGSTVARLIGASYATSDILSYLDSHVEVNNHWLDPILRRIKQNEKVIVMSTMDTIDNDKFYYQKSYNTYTGTFNWKLEFYWTEISDRVKAQRRREIDPIPSAVMPAGAFALRRDWFIKLGMFDPHMRIWGVDDVEFSFRAWQCGSTIEMLPCSRVAHIFRNIPYSFGDNAGRVIYHNGVRTAEITLENYKKYFYAQAKQFTELNLNITSLRDRIKMKQEMKCRDFAWFMQNIVPEMPLPPEDAVYYEKIKMKSNEEKCLTLDSDTLNIRDCTSFNRSQFFYITKNGHLINMQSKLCIMLEKLNIIVDECSKVSNKWVYHGKYAHHISDKNFVFCLTAINSTEVKMTSCQSSDKSQRWKFTYHFSWNKKLSYL